MRITPGDTITYRIEHRVKIRLIEVTEISPDAYAITGQRITHAGNIDERDLTVPHSTTIHGLAVDVIVFGDTVYFDDETGCNVTWNRDEEAYYVWHGDGCVGMVDTFAEAKEMLEELAA